MLMTKSQTKSRCQEIVQQLFPVQEVVRGQEEAWGGERSSESLLPSAWSRGEEVGVGWFCSGQHP